jgi:hypothetical protein
VLRRRRRRGPIEHFFGRLCKRNGGAIAAVLSFTGFERIARGFAIGDAFKLAGTFGFPNGRRHHANGGADRHADRDRGADRTANGDTDGNG